MRALPQHVTTLGLYIVVQKNFTRFIIAIISSTVFKYSYFWHTCLQEMFNKSYTVTPPNTVSVTALLWKSWWQLCPYLLLCLYVIHSKCEKSWLDPIHVIKWNKKGYNRRLKCRPWALHKLEADHARWVLLPELNQCLRQSIFEFYKCNYSHSVVDYGDEQ